MRPQDFEPINNEDDMRKFMDSLVEHNFHISIEKNQLLPFNDIQRLQIPSGYSEEDEEKIIELWGTDCMHMCNFLKTTLESEFQEAQIRQSFK